MSTQHRAIALGLDVGTTKAAATIVDGSSREVLAVEATPHDAEVRGLLPGRSEQRVVPIIEALEESVQRLPAGLKSQVGAIGVTGQMHGVVVWSSEAGATSSLITWQDQRCCEGSFIEGIRESAGAAALQPGFGLATLAWIARHDPALLGSHSQASTIQDFIAARISGNRHGHTDPSDAASWGLFDIRARAWDLSAISRAGIPAAILPKVVPAGAPVGFLDAAFARRWGLRPGILVGNALGDNQASVYGSLTAPDRQVALSIGTGAQLSVVIQSLPHDVPAGLQPFEYRPFVGDSYIAVVASLTGGRALAALAQALRTFIGQSGIAAEPSLETILTEMHAQGLSKLGTSLRANASLAGERCLPDMRGSFAGLSFDNFTIGDMTSALCRGLVTGLREAMPEALLRGRPQIVGSGNAICRSPLMQQVIREAFGRELILSELPEATACGAAFLAASALASGVQ